MRKIMQWVMAATLVFSGATTAQAQALKAADLEKYAKEKYGDKWIDAAKNIAEGLTLDKNESLTYQEVIQAEGKTREQLYVALNYWATATFPPSSSGGPAITLNDKEAGCIIITSTIPGIVEHMGTISKYTVSITPVIRLDIKDGRVRVTYTVQSYDILRDISGGWFGITPDGENNKWRRQAQEGRQDQREPLRRAVGDSPPLPVRGEGCPEAHLRQGTGDDTCLLQRHHRQGGGSAEERHRR